MRFRALCIALVASIPLAACTYDEGPDPSKRFLPAGNGRTAEEHGGGLPRLRLQDENTLSLHEREHCGNRNYYA